MIVAVAVVVGMIVAVGFSIAIMILGSKLTIIMDAGNTAAFWTKPSSSAAIIRTLFFTVTSRNLSHI
jgi:hypothetical protein